MTDNQRDQRAYILRALEHAPKTPPSAAGLRGFWIGEGWYLCAGCAGRIMARGCRLPEPAVPVWTDRPEPFGECLGCKERRAAS